jgi:polar amino acid transport system substrate-binding protein
MAALCLAAGLMVGCSSTSNSSSTTTSASTTTQTASDSVAPPNNTLIVGFDAGYPPYGYKDTKTGKYTGIDLDLAKEVCKRNGWTFKAEPIDWDAKDALLDQGNITCIWNGFTYEGRENDYAFTDKYMINGQVVVVRADSDIKSLSDLKDKTVMTQVKSAALDVLDGDMKNLQDTFKGGKVQTVSDYNNAFMQLESGNVDAVACDLSIAAYQMAAKPNAYKQLDEKLSSEHYAVGFKKDDQGQALAAKVTQTLKEMDADGTVKKICEKYSDQGISYSNWCLGDKDSSTAATNQEQVSSGTDFGAMMAMVLPDLASGFVMSLQIFLITLVGALPLGVLIALARMSRFRVVAAIARIYISVHARHAADAAAVRRVMFGSVLPGFGASSWSAIPGSFNAPAPSRFILNYAAYFAEIYRGGIQSIPRGQHEAAEVLGYTKFAGVHEDHPAAGHQAHPAAHGQRDHHAWSRTRRWHSSIGIARDVHGGEGIVAAVRSSTCSRSWLAAAIYYDLQRSSSRSCMNKRREDACPTTTTR